MEYSNEIKGEEAQLTNALRGTYKDGAGRQLTINSIANYVCSISAKCLKRSEKRNKSSQKTRNCERFKPNRPLAYIERAQDAIEFVVTNHKNTSEVLHG
jgi:hypothetical protein